MTFGDNQWKLGGVDLPMATQMVAMAMDVGVNFFDTADIYSYGESETMLGRALEGRRHQVVVATKARGEMGSGPNEAGLSRAHLYDALHQSLRRLQTDYIDLYQVHGFDPDTPMEETLATLNRFVEEGKVRYIGLSNFAAWQIVKASMLSAARGWARFVSAQMYYSLANRDIEHEVVPACLDQGLGILPWSPLSGGFLSGKYRASAAPEGARFSDGITFPYFDRDRALDVLGPLEEIAGDHRVSMAAVALAWLRDRPGVTSVIVGARRPEQLQDNLAAATLTLDTAAVSRLDELTRPEALYPGWMIAMQTGRS